MYKIRHKITGLYKRSGGYDRWSKHGKVWAQKGHLKLHLSMCYPKLQELENWEVIEFVMGATEPKVYSVQEFYPKIRVH